MSSRSMLHPLSRALPLALLLAAPGSATAALSSNVALVSDYTFRGATQTNREPAIQGGFDIGTEGGVYVGTWASSISWLSDLGDISSHVEIDAYGGYRGSFSETVTYDIGVIHYWYPGSFPGGFNAADTTELYVGISAGIFAAKYSYAVSDLFGYADSEGSGYLDLALNWGFADAWTLNVHGGRQWIENNEDFEYSDWKLGVTRAFDNGVSIALAYIDTNADEALYTNPYGEYVGDSTLVLSIGRSF